MPELTEKQAKAWEEDVTPRLERHGISSNLRSHYWHVQWGEEARPGRGHYFDGYFIDGEHFVQVMMDVYGYPSVSIATLDWIHADSDEGLVCETCKAAHKHKMRFAGRTQGVLAFECLDVDCPEEFETTFDMWGESA